MQTNALGEQDDNSTNFYTVTWQNQDARGSVDYIDVNWFKISVPTPLTHITRVAGVLVEATCDVEPKDGYLLFKYGGKHAATNKARNLFPGDLKIVPNEFRSASKLEWKGGDRDAQLLSVVVKPLQAREGVRRVGQSSHLKRNSQLAAFKVAQAKYQGGLKCQACHFSGSPAYGAALDRCFEVHHRRVLANGERISVLEDLALLCSNCHRVLHGLGEVTFEVFIARFSIQR